MTEWKPIEDAPKDGKPLLLWARLKSNPPGPSDHYPMVGFWPSSIVGWAVYPQHLSGEQLIPTHWAELPASPPTQRAGQ